MCVCDSVCVCVMGRGRGGGGGIKGGTGEFKKHLFSLRKMAAIVVILNNYEEKRSYNSQLQLSLSCFGLKQEFIQDKATMNGYGLINKLAAYSHFSVVIQYCAILISNVLNQPLCDTCVRFRVLCMKH